MAARNVANQYVHAAIAGPIGKGRAGIAKHFFRRPLDRARQSGCKPDRCAATLQHDLLVEINDPVFFPALVEEQFAGTVANDEIVVTVTAEIIGCGAWQDTRVNQWLRGLDAAALLETWKSVFA